MEHPRRRQRYCDEMHEESQKLMEDGNKNSLEPAQRKPRNANACPKSSKSSRARVFERLQSQGFTIRSIVPDGNCLFRSCADQLFGNQNRHMEVRKNAVHYMMQHKENYIPFMDQDREPFAKYVNRMMKSGTWGGDLEINAISHCYKCNVVVYQDRRPDLELQNFPDVDRVLRMVYVGSCHYLSVRGKNYVALSLKSSSNTVVLRPDGSKMPIQVAKSATSSEEINPVGKPKIEPVPEVAEEEVSMMEPKLDAAATPKNEVKSKPQRVLSKEEIMKRNLKVIRHMKKRFKVKKHVCSDQWCGDLPFDQLVTEEMVERLKVIPRKHQLKGVLKFLTMKCPCNSGSYFKYCCFPKIKAWWGYQMYFIRSINRNRYHLSKFRV